MSGWRLAVREVYDAGGVLPIARVSYPSCDIAIARRHGLLQPAGGRGDTTASRRW